MSRYYGTLTSDKGVSTRAAHYYVLATAQSHAGSVGVEIGGVDPIVIIKVADESNASPTRILLQMPLQQLLSAAALALE